MVKTILKFSFGFVFGLICSAVLVYFFLDSFSLPSLKTYTPSFFYFQKSDSQSYSKKLKDKVPILMYHHVASSPSADSSSGLYVSLEDFKEQMIFLYAKEYKSIFIDDLFRDSSLDGFVITFDDGYKDVIQNAYPILKKLEFKATVFLIVDKIGEDGYLTKDDIASLQKDGWSFGSHTLSHRNLLSLNRNEAQNEIENSKKELETMLKKPVNFFCYPVGKFDEDIIKLVKAAGYRGAVTTISGQDQELSLIFQLKRIRVSGFDTLESFAGKVKE